MSRLRGRVPTLVVVAAVAAVSVSVILGVRAWSTGGDARPWRKPATVDHDRLVLTYVDSACRNHEHVEVRETSQRVTVTIRTRTLAVSCSDANEEYAVEVTLDAPLGDRVLRDGACGPRESQDESCTGSTRPAGARPRVG